MSQAQSAPPASNASETLSRESARKIDDLDTLALPVDDSTRGAFGDWWRDVSSALSFSLNAKRADTSDDVLCDISSLQSANKHTVAQSLAPQSDMVSTVASSCESVSSYSETGSTVAYDDVWLGPRILPYRAYAHRPHDVYVLGSFLELARVQDVDEKSVILLFKALKFMRRCNYASEDICSILAHASAYFIDVQAHCGTNISRSEAGNILVLLMFVAHSYVQDETCPLRYWHKHLFRRYCEYKTLNSAVIKMLEIRRWILRLEHEDLVHRYSKLTWATNRA